MTGLTTKKKQISTVFLLGLILVSSLTVLVPQAKGDSPAVQKCLDFSSNVLGVDLSKCSVGIVSDVNSTSSNFGGLPRETLSISLSFAAGSMQSTFVFLNGAYTYCTASIQGTISYAQPLPADPLNSTKELLHRYQQYASTENLQDMATLLNSIGEMATTNATQGDAALTIDTHGGTTLIDVTFYSAVNGIAFPTGLTLQINGQGGVISDMTQFLHVGNATLAVSPNEAAQIGLQAAKAITVSVQGSDGSYSSVPIALLVNPLTIHLVTGTREPFTQYPEYYIFFGPDGSQGIRYGVLIYVWGDNGEVAYCQAQSTYGPPSTLYPLPTPIYVPVPTPTPQPTSTSTPQPIQTSTPQPTQTATPQPTASPTPTLPPNFVEVKTKDGSTIDLPISGNVSSTQMSNVTLSTDLSAAVTTLSFTGTGQSGSTGFGNITIPKTALTNNTMSTVPMVLIDGAQALNQSYTQDATNFYLSYTVHFSTHQIAIVFAPPVVEPTATAPPSPTQSPTPTPNLKMPNPIFTQGIIFVTILIAFMASIAISVKLIKRQKGKS